MESRRAFVQKTILALGGLSALSGGAYYFYQSSKKITGTYYNIDYRPRGTEKDNDLVKVDLETGNKQKFQIQLDPHSVLLAPHNPNLCLLIEKWDRSIALLDTQKGEILAKFEHSAMSGRQFIGHALFSPDGKLIYTSEAIFDGDKKGEARGFIGVRSASTLELLKEYSSNGKDPHELVWLKGDLQFAVCNQGHYQNGKTDQDRNISIIEASSGKLIEHIKIPLGLSPAHLKRFGENHLAVVTRSLDFHNVFEQDQRLLVKHNGEDIKVLPLPPQLKGKLSKELLSLAISEKQAIIGTTYPEGRKLIFWDLNKLEHLKTIETGQVTGISLSLDGEYFVVNDLDYGTRIYSVKNLEEVMFNSLQEFAKEKLAMPHSLIF